MLLSYACLHITQDTAFHHAMSGFLFTPCAIDYESIYFRIVDQRGI